MATNADLVAKLMSLPYESRADLLSVLGAAARCDDGKDITAAVLAPPRRVQSGAAASRLD